MPLVGWLYEGQEGSCKDAVYARLMPGLQSGGLPPSWLPTAPERAAAHNASTIECTIESTIECTIESTIECTIESTIECTIESTIEWELPLEELRETVERVASDRSTWNVNCMRMGAAFGLEWGLGVSVERLSTDGPDVQLAIILKGSFKHVPKPDHDHNHEVLRSVGWPRAGQHSTGAPMHRPCAHAKVVLTGPPCCPAFQAWGHQRPPDLPPLRPPCPAQPHPPRAHCTHGRHRTGAL